MSDFAELLKSLQAVADEQDKDAAPAGGNDDANIQAAADDAGVDANPEDADGDADDKPMAKSVVAGADGEEVEVIDATEVLKSLQAGQTELGDTLTKSMTMVLGIVKSQGELIKSMKSEISQLKGQGRGRKTVLTVTEKPDAITKSLGANDQPTGIKPQEFLAKCLAAQREGTMTGLDVSRAEIAINNGVPVPADIVARIK